VVGQQRDSFVNMKDGPNRSLDSCSLCCVYDTSDNLFFLSRPIGFCWFSAPKIIYSRCEVSFPYAEIDQCRYLIFNGDGLCKKYNVLANRSVARHETVGDIFAVEGRRPDYYS